MLALITFSVGSLLLLVAVLMLLRHAFRTSMLWGILGLLFTIPLYIYALLRWEEVPIRKPVYISLVGILAVLVGISGGALSHLTFIPENEVVNTLEEKIAPPKETPLPNEEEAQAIQLPDGEAYDPLLTGGEFEVVDIEEMSPPPAVVASRAETKKYETIEIADIDRAIGKRVKLNLINGENIEGILTHRQKESIIVESFVSGGAVGYTYPIADIKLISALDLAPVAELALENDNLELESTAEATSVVEEVENVVEEVGPAIETEQVSGSVAEQVESVVDSAQDVVEQEATSAVEAEQVLENVTQ